MGVGLSALGVGSAYQSSLIASMLVRPVASSVKVLDEKISHDVKGLAGFRKIRIVEEAMTEPVPDVQVGIHSSLDTVLM